MSVRIFVFCVWALDVHSALQEEAALDTVAIRQLSSTRWDHVMYLKVVRHIFFGSLHVKISFEDIFRVPRSVFSRNLILAAYLHMSVHFRPHAGHDDFIFLKMPAPAVCMPPLPRKSHTYLC